LRTKGPRPQVPSRLKFIRNSIGKQPNRLSKAIAMSLINFNLHDRGSLPGVLVFLVLVFLSVLFNSAFGCGLLLGTFRAHSAGRILAGIVELNAARRKAENSMYVREINLISVVACPGVIICPSLN
jgi:hypothetical protein